MPQQTQELHIRTDHGHTDTHVVLRFSRPIDNLTFTPEQARAFIANVEKSLVLLAEHQKRKAAGG